MPTLTLNFNEVIQTSVQVGDKIYFTPVTSNYLSSGFDTNGTIYEIGPCASIAGNRLSMTVTYVTGVATPGTAPYNGTNFILFSKDKGVNPSGLIGYYAEVQIKTNRKDKISELFSVGSEIFESSK